MSALPDPYLAPLCMFCDTEYYSSNYFFPLLCNRTRCYWITAWSFNSDEANEGGYYLEDLAAVQSGCYTSVLEKRTLTAMKFL